MATLIRSRDHSMWFKHIDDPEDVLITRLRTLDAGQSVVLRLGQHTGVWTRFGATNRGTTPEALKCGDEHSKQIWQDLPVGGLGVEITLIEVLSLVDSKRSTSSPRTRSITLEHISSEVQGDVLCVAVDVAWWGGQTGKGKRDTRTETIAYTSRVDGEWSGLSLKRVDLNDSYNSNADPFTPNADANASTLTAGIKDVLDAHERIEKIVLAVDMPILAKDEGMPPPRKANERDGEGGQSRQCDVAWTKQRSASPKGWRNVNIFAGAPTVPRVRALVDKLRELGFGVYRQCTMEQERVVFECFPNEVVWSAGVLGFAHGLTVDSLQLYKRLGKKKIPLPEDLFAGIWKHTVDAGFASAGMDPETRSSWLHDFGQWLAADGVFDDDSKIGCTGKSFDDAVDSVLSLSAVIAFVTGNAHIHQGIDPEDGHIIGPGITSFETREGSTQ